MGWYGERWGIEECFWTLREGAGLLRRLAPDPFPARQVLSLARYARGFPETPTKAPPNGGERGMIGAFGVRRQLRLPAERGARLGTDLRSSVLLTATDVYRALMLTAKRTLKFFLFLSAPVVAAYGDDSRFTGSSAVPNAVLAVVAGERGVKDGFAPTGEALDGSVEYAAENGNDYQRTLEEGAWLEMSLPLEATIGTSLTAAAPEDRGGASLLMPDKREMILAGTTCPVGADGGLVGELAVDAMNSRTVIATNGLADPALMSGDDPIGGVTGEGTHLILTGNAAAGEGMFSIATLQGTGMACDAGDRFVDRALEQIKKVRADVTALLALNSKPAELGTNLDTQWRLITVALDAVFKTRSIGRGANSAVRLNTPLEENILGEIEDILDALATEDAFVAATEAGGDGVFESQEMSAAVARDTFNRVMWVAAATFDTTQDTRYGTVIRKSTSNAKDNFGDGAEEFGAFSYSTVSVTSRTWDAAARVSQGGRARYSGGTEAISGSGTAYSGTMEVEVRFLFDSVSGMVKDLIDADGQRWQYNFADVDSIILDEMPLRGDGRWSGNGRNAMVIFTANAGLLRPVQGLANQFRGFLLGKGRSAGSMASGAWSLESSDSSNYLTGGFGVRNVVDESRPQRRGQDVSLSNAMLSTRADAARDASVSVGDGMFALTLQDYGWARGASGVGYTSLATADRGPILLTAEFDLDTLARSPAPAVTQIHGPKHVDIVKAVLEAQRDRLLAPGGLEARRAVWQRVQDAVAYNLFGGNLPAKLARNYVRESDLERDAVILIEDVLDAISSDSKLMEALDPDGSGIFNQTWADRDGDYIIDPNEQREDYILYDEGDRRYEINNRSIAEFLSERSYTVNASLGTTDHTRFGIWYRDSSQSASRTPGNVRKDLGGPGAFAYSPLAPTPAGSYTNPGFPAGGRAVYLGETVALQNRTVLTGTVRVDVDWGTPRRQTGDAVFGGTMSLTISNLVNSNGDPLSYGGTSEDRINDPPRHRPGNEITEIVFSGLSIGRGVAGSPRAGQLIVGTAAADNANAAEITYSESPVSRANIRYRFAAADMTDRNRPMASAGVKALFVGPGVAGPLGVMGTWTLNDDSVGRISVTGQWVDDLADHPIHGAFGADIP